MARLIQPDGTETQVTPKGKKWTLAEMQLLIGGDIQEMPGVRGLRMYFDEEGKLKSLPLNQKATEIVQQAVREEAARRQCGIRYMPVLVGNVLILEAGDRI